MKKFRNKTDGPEPGGERKLRAAGYVRVSTEEQAQHGYSIDAQKDRLQLACKAAGYKLVNLYVDEGYSAKNLQRPAVQQLIDDSRKKKLDIILVYKVDRLSRRLSDLIPLGEKLEKWGVAIKSVTEPFETSTPSGKLLFNMLGSFAQFEREMIGDRVRLALNKRLRDGKWNNRPPYGYKTDKEGFLRPEPGEIENVRRIFRLALEHNLGALSIARLLQQEDRTTRRKGKWTRNGVWNIISNPVYIGKLNVGGELIKGVHEPAVSEEDFFRLQEMLKTRLNEAPRTHRSPNILVGLVRCGKCGRAMTTQKGTGRAKQRYHYYACALRVEKCGMPYIGARALERSVLRKIREIAEHPGMLETCLQEHRKFNRDQAKTLLNEKMSAQKRLEGLETSRQKRVRWLIDTLPAKGVADQVNEALKGQLEEIQALKAKVAELERKLSKIDRADYDALQVSRYLKRFVECYDELDVGQRRLLMQALVKEAVVLDKRRCRVEFYIPLPTGKQPTKPAAVEVLPEKAALFQSKRKPEPDYSQVPVPLLVQNGSRGRTQPITI